MTGMGDHCDNGHVVDCCGNCGCEPDASDAETEREARATVLREFADWWVLKRLADENYSPGGPSMPAIAARYFADKYAPSSVAAGSACECPPCPGRGNDGHGMTHCAECCFGTGVVADIGCPIHGEAAVQAGSDMADEPEHRASAENCIASDRGQPISSGNVCFHPDCQPVPSPAPAGIVQEPEGRIMGVDHGPFPTLGSSPAPEEITHACPRRGEMVAPCCGITPFELPRTDRMTSDPALVTCSVSSPEPDDERDALAQVIEYAHRTGPVSVGEPSMARESADLILAAGWKSPTEVAALVASTRAQVAGEVVEMCRQESKKASLRELSDRNAYLRRTVWDRAERFARAAAEGGGQ